MHDIHVQNILYISQKTSFDPSQLINVYRIYVDLVPANDLDVFVFICF